MKMKHDMASTGTTDAKSTKYSQPKGGKPGAGGKAWSDADVSKGYKSLGPANPQSNPQKAQNMKMDKGKPVNEPKY